MRQGGVLQVGVDLFDDGVSAVGLVRGDGVERSAGAVVKNAWKRHTSNRVSCPAALLRFGVQVRDPAHDQPARDLVGLVSVRRTR